MSDEVGDDLEQVEGVQRKFDDFQKDLKANEARLIELNTEAAEKIRIQIEDLNQRWAALQQTTQERAQTLGSAHEVQLYHRDADETKDWIEEKETTLNSTDLDMTLLPSSACSASTKVSSVISQP